MQVDLPNRVDNLKLPKTRPLLPLFEAISNSIDAIEETRKKGRIDIYVERDATQRALDETAPPTEPISGFTIVDNGIGFTKPNFDSFCTSDSSWKRSSGGKGIGRLSWLWAFHHADIESVFKSEADFEVRSFRFEKTKQGIARHRCKAANGESKATTVRLVESTQAFRSACPKTAEKIGLKIIEHFLQIFTRSRCPDIYIHDACEEQAVHLNKLFRDDVSLEETSKTYKLKQHEFTIRHVRLSTQIASAHQLHFCARGRAVTEENAAKWVSNLKAVKLESLADGPAFFYAAYVSSPFFEDRLVADRNSFEIPYEQNLIPGEDELSWEKIVREAARKAGTFLARYTAPARKAKLEWVKEYAQRHPKYRPLIKHREQLLDSIPFGISEEELELHLYKLSQKYDLELKEQGRRFENAVQSGKDLKGQKGRFEQFIGEWNEAGKAKLCDYVVHRRATLEFLADCLKRTDANDVALEDVIHDTIFPMQATSDDYAADASNLWVIDERLAYHYYLASDKPLKTVEPIGVARENGRQRGDLVVFQRFDNPTLVVNSEHPFDAITIIEFKRPGRDDYTAAKNPIDQVDKYIVDIQSGSVKDRFDRLIQPRLGTPYYAYIVCTITPSLERIAKMRGFIRTPDGQGFMKMHPTLLAYQEIISYDKLLADANKRNQAFFEKLELPKS